MRNEIDAELVAIDLVHGETHAVERHRTLARDITRQRFRRREFHAQRARIVRGDENFGETIDMARHPVTAEAVAGAQAWLEIHARAVALGAERGHAQRLAGNVGLKAGRAELGDCQAYAVHTNAVAEIEPLAWYARESHFDAAIFRAVHTGARFAAPDDSDFMHDAREHYFPLGRSRSRKSGPTTFESSNSNSGAASSLVSRARAAKGFASLPSSFGAMYSSHSSTRLAANRAPASRDPASTSTSFTSSSARRANTACRSRWERETGIRSTRALPSRSSPGPALRSRVGAANTSTSPGAARIRAVLRNARRRSSTTRIGWRGVSIRTSSRGSSAITVAALVSTAPLCARQCCTSARAASLVIHWLSPFANAVLPSRLAPVFRRMNGRRCRMRMRKPALRASASASNKPDWTLRPASFRRAAPAPLTRGFGSPMAYTTRRTPAASSTSTHGGVRP